MKYSLPTPLPQLLDPPSTFFFLNLFIYFWLRWVFVAARGLLLAVASLSCCGARALGARASVVVAHGLQ